MPASNPSVDIPHTISNEKLTMLQRSAFYALWGVLTAVTSVLAGNVYQITSQVDGKTVNYEVSFGGGKVMDRYTAFDPESKKFVYLEWNRKEKSPDAVMKVWDHCSGKTILLYAFPDAKHPLPIIPNLDAMKVCPITNDKNYASRLHAIFD